MLGRNIWLNICTAIHSSCYSPLLYQVLVIATFFSLIIRDPEKEDSDEPAAPHLQDDEEYLHRQLTEEELNDPKKMAELEAGMLDEDEEVKGVKPPEKSLIEEARETRFVLIPYHFRKDTVITMGLIFITAPVWFHTDDLFSQSIYSVQCLFMIWTIRCSLGQYTIVRECTYPILNMAQHFALIPKTCFQSRGQILPWCGSRLPLLAHALYCSSSQAALTRMLSFLKYWSPDFFFF